MNKYGFSLIELMISIGIIAILIGVGTVSYGGIRDRAQGNKVATDFQQIALGWQVWKNAGNLVYPDETVGNNPDIACFTEPAIDQTVVQPFLEDTHRGPWGVRYSYDNDGDTFNGFGNIDRGVNVVLQWCAGNGARYIQLAPFIDDTIDGGNGANAGDVRWNTDPNADGGIIYMIAENEDS